ncbi:MAG: class I SAM-dependent methyltransferase [Chloroflexota bacterium]|nr:class I SAM-dependent methyltransferase [Chloroflexota bacterium]
MSQAPQPVFTRIPCDICGTWDYTPVGRPRVGSDMESIVSIPEDICVARCTQCGFLYTQPMPFWRAEHLQQIYGAAYFPKMTRWWERTKTRANPRRRLNTVEGLTGSGPVRFLEVGCGLGYGIEDAMRRGWTVNGQDVSRFFAGEVQSRLGVDVFVGPLAEAGYPSSSFDVVYVDSVLEHLPQPMEMLREVRRILKPGGVAYLTVTNEDALIARFRASLGRLTRSKRSPALSPLDYPVHLVGFTPFTLRLACEGAGFEVASMLLLAGPNEWRKYGLSDAGKLLSHLTCYPVYVAGEWLGKAIAIEAVVVAREEGPN